MVDRVAPRPVDARALERAVARVQAAPQAPWLHGEVARRMAERLLLIKHRPRRVIDWWSHSGASREALATAYPQATLIAVEHAAAPRPLALPWWRRLAPGARGGWSARVERVDEAALAACPPEPADLLWANMALHGVSDPRALIGRWQGLVAVGGFLMFSTLGPGTLEALREAYRARGWPSPLAPFVDMHDLGDMLVEAGFADPVMDQETITLTWPDAEAALAELRSLGANAAPDRAAGLRTPRWRRDLSGLLQGQTAGRRAPDEGGGGRVALGFEIVYGHAFRAAPRARGGAETAVPLDEMRQMVRAGRTRTVR